MKLYDEKMLVGIELMGWGIYYPSSHAPEYSSFERGGRGAKLMVYNWNPQTDRRCWPEIWDNMNWNQIKSIVKILIYWANKNRNIKTIPEIKFDEVTICWKMLTTKPEICWKALIPILKGHTHD